MSNLRRIAVIALLIFTAISILVSSFIVIQVWRFKQPITDRLNSSIETFNSTLVATDQALTVAENTLDSATTTITSLVLTLGALERVIKSSQPTIESLQNLMQETLPDTVSSIQTSFDSAQQSAKVIDTVLRSVTAIPFFPGEPYNPAIPLHESLANVSQSMSELPTEFQAMEDSLKSTGGNLIYFQQQINQVKANVSTINRSLDSSRSVLDQYQTIVSNTLDSLESVQRQLPNFITQSVWVLTFLIIWLAIFQIYLLIKCIDILRYKSKTAQVTIEEPAQLEARIVSNDEP